MVLKQICHVITGLGRGGAETMLEKLLASARAGDPAIGQQVISLRDEGVIGPRLRQQGVPLSTLGMHGVAAAPAALLALRRRIRALPPGSVVQSWMYHADLFSALATRGMSAPPLVWNVRQTGLSAADIGRSTQAVVHACGWLSHRAPARIVSNSVAAIDAHAAWGYDRSRFAVVPNGFDTQAFQPDAQARARQRRAWGVADDERVVGLVARLDAQKDHATFAAAAARVLAAVPKSPALRFVLVGQHIDTDRALGELLAQHGIAAFCLRLPQSDEVAAVMNALDVACLSSRAEGFPNVLGEAMACATPVVTTAAGDAASIVDDPLRTAPVGDSAALAAALLHVLRLPAAQRLALGERDRRRVATEYPIDGVWRRYRTLYETVLVERAQAVGRPRADPVPRS